MNNLATSSSGTTTAVEEGAIQAASEVSTDISTRKLIIVIFMSSFSADPKMQTSLHYLRVEYLVNVTAAGQ